MLSLLSAAPELAVVSSVVLDMLVEVVLVVLVDVVVPTSELAPPAA